MLPQTVSPNPPASSSSSTARRAQGAARSRTRRVSSHGGHRLLLDRGIAQLDRRLFEPTLVREFSFADRGRPGDRRIRPLLVLNFSNSSRAGASGAGPGHRIFNRGSGRRRRPSRRRQGVRPGSRAGARPGRAEGEHVRVPAISSINSGAVDRHAHRRSHEVGRRSRPARRVPPAGSGSGAHRGPSGPGPRGLSWSRGSPRGAGSQPRIEADHPRRRLSHRTGHLPHPARARRAARRRPCRSGRARGSRGHLLASARPNAFAGAIQLIPPAGRIPRRSRPRRGFRQVTHSLHPRVEERLAAPPRSVATLLGAGYTSEHAS